MEQNNLNTVIESGCPHYTNCGGCSFRHIDSENQRQIRTKNLLDLFSKHNLSVKDFQILYGKADGYRCRMQLHNGGLKEKKSDNIVPIQDCPIATKEIRNWLKAVPPEKRPKGRITIFGDSRASKFNSPSEKIIISQETENTKSQITGKTNRKIKNKVKKHYSGTVSDTDNLCSVTLKALDINQNTIEKKILFDVRGFFQSNLEMTESLISLILSNCNNSSSEDRVLDIYSGAGTFSTFLAEKFKHVTLVEHNRDALVYAEQNMLGLPHDSFGIKAELWAKNYAADYIKNNGNFKMALIDPPRSGMEKSVLEFLGKSLIPRILSVSCNPVTQAENCAYLVQQGYKLNKLYFLDFYPQTTHIESLAILELE